MVLAVLHLVSAVLVVAAWFAIPLTGRYPRPLFDSVVGTWRWTLCVAAHTLLLVTDTYPPFSLQ